MALPVHPSRIGASNHDSRGRFGYYPALDGVRAIAIAAVIGVHVRVLPGGGIGVLIFFVLSGFLITSLLLHEQRGTGTISLRLFYARRALRLLPALIIMLAAACTFALLERPSPLSHQTLHFAPAALFYFANWVTATHASGVAGTLGHTWSLSVEEQFYIVWAIVLLAMLAGGARLRWVAAVALLGVLASDLGKWWLWRSGSLPADAKRMFGTDLSGDALMLGCALAVAVLTRPELTRRAVRIAALPAAAFLFWEIAFVHPLSGSFAAARLYEVVIWPLSNVAAAVVIGYLVLVPGSWLERCLSLRPFRYTGRISYGLYLWHYPIIIWLIVLFGFNDNWWQILVSVTASFTVAAMSYEIVERHALALKNRLAAGRAQTEVYPARADWQVGFSRDSALGQPVIELNGVGKRYRKLEEQAMLLRAILPLTRPVSRELWALRNLSLTVREGEIVGVLGHNGAGKTTLLRLLAGVTTPTEGSVRVVGRIAPLISLGVGFHEEMSGRENVLVNGMLLGLTQRQVLDRFDSIVDFAELWDFIDTPVKFYSSGMSMRLGFAVVAHIDPTILLVDEILAVGDAAFRLKCFDRLRRFQDEGAAILVVSHALAQVRELCSRAILIRHGRLEYDGAVDEAIALHETLSDRPVGEAVEDVVEVLEQQLLVPQGQEAAVEYDQEVTLWLRLRFRDRVADPQFTVGIVAGGGQFGGFNVTEPGRVWRTFEAGEECDVRAEFPVRFAGGIYGLRFDIRSRDGRRILGRVIGPEMRVASRGGVAGMVDLSADLVSEPL